MNGAARFLAACGCEATDATPVWFMRQAGGQLPSYLALRERYSVMDIATTPALCAEVSVAAVDALGVDGAVLYADIMLLVQAMGVPVELTASGPVIERPVRSIDAVDGLRVVDTRTDLGFVLQAIGLVRGELAGRAAVIGICGGPFTLGAYLVEGTPSRDQLVARALIHREPATWHALMERLTLATIDYARAQVNAGADVVQVFDSWAASLTADEYRVHVAPWTRRILAAIAAAGVPSIHSVARSAPILDEIAAAGPSVIAIDSRQSLAAARQHLGTGQAVQGNLDPALVLAGAANLRAGARRVLDEVAGGIGHVFNTGEALPRDADPAILRDLVSFVHDQPVLNGRPAREFLHV